MKVFPLFLALLTAQFGLSQNKISLEDLLSNTVCDCIDKQKTISEESFMECLTPALQEHESLIIKECWRRYKDTSYEASRKLGKLLMDSLTISMVYTCDAYRKSIDSARYNVFKGIPKDSIQYAIDILEQNNSPRTKNFYLSRGFMYFISEDFAKALLDFNQALLIAPKDIDILSFKAWSLESMKKFDQATAIYNQLALQTKKKEYRIFAAICKQKSK
jgi:tetratricopeptide (TPR) repeat protein